ncbi:hypothetical protein FACS1894113_1260 [Alphaproteobacteria bacterium]|nr:hypothetical protein FACS1894113_1260 [Alphaproteobacteria bacterium]
MIKFRTIIAAFACFFVLTACSLFPEINVWLRKVDFEVDPGANKGEPFVCHIVVAYSKDLYDALSGMDAQGYFPNADALKKKYKDSIEIFEYDMIPGKNKLEQKIRLRSYRQAKAAFLFARYSTPGKFMENVGTAPSIVVRFLPYKMELISATSLEALVDKAK